MKTQALDVEYLALSPASENGIGVGFMTFRSRGKPQPITIALQRAALERLREDIDSILNAGTTLSNTATVNKARRERVVLSSEILEKLGFNDFEYTGSKET